MKVVILAGGYGTRLSEETVLKPKPLIEIGGKPILWHIMKIYSHYGFNDFIICLGYKGYAIKEYFSNYFLHMSDVTFDMANNSVETLEKYVEPWRVTLIDTGLETMTGGRIGRIQKYIDGTFMLTYGDGVGDINIKELVDFHTKNGKLATVTSVQPPGRFGTLDIDNDNHVRRFLEKPSGDGIWISGGFFVLEPDIFKYISGDEVLWEREPLTQIALDGQLMSYQHHGFWQPVDTMREKNILEELWDAKKAPWKVWN
ncbi:MAG: glucose-1-phosphate cytidylyltransferase [bacterium]